MVEPEGSRIEVDIYQECGAVSLKKHHAQDEEKEQVELVRTGRG